MSSSGNDQQDAPKWLNEAFIEKILRSEYGDADIKVFDAVVTRATAPGDNYMSVIYRIKVQMAKSGLLEVKSFIVKTESFGDLVRRYTTEGEIFEQEIRMLKDVIPAMHRLLDEVMPGKYHPFAPKHIYSHVNEQSRVIVTEDLKELRYSNHERTTGLDKDHCIAVVRSLAHFHAASVVLRETDPQLIEPFLDVKSNETTKTEFGDITNASILKLSNEVAKWPEYGEKYAKKIRDISVNAIDVYMKCRARSYHEFNVLGHGDLWMANIMFRYDPHNNIDVRFVDYQICSWMSPAIDILLFLNSSTSFDLLDKYDIFIDEYHKTLGETLTLLGFGHLHPTRETLDGQLNDRRIYGTMVLFTMRTFVFLERKEVQDINEALKDGEPFNYSKLYTDYLKLALPILDKNGWS